MSLGRLFQTRGVALNIKPDKPNCLLVFLKLKKFGGASAAKNFREIQTKSPPRGRQIEVGRFTSALFDQYLAISETVQDRDILSTEG